MYAVSQGRGVVLGGDAFKGSSEKYGRDSYHGGSAPDLSSFSSEARE